MANNCHKFECYMMSRMCRGIIEGEIRGGSGGGEHDEHTMDYLALIP